MIKMVKTISDTIIWLAQERIKQGEPYKSLNSAIHAVKMEITLQLIDFMKDQKKEK